MSKKKIKNIVTIEDIHSATPKQLRKYFKDDEKENFMRIKNLDDEAREFLRRKIARNQSHFNVTSLFSVLITFMAIAVAILSLDLSKVTIPNWIYTFFPNWIFPFLPTLGELKFLSLIYLSAFALVPILLIIHVYRYIDLEDLIDMYELKELKKY